MLAFRVQLLAPGVGGPVQAAAAGQLPFGLSGQVEVEFVAGEQEQEAEADVGQQVDGGPIGPAERLGADQHATDQQDHHLEDARAGQQGHQQRSERGHHPRDQQHLQPPGKIHDPAPFPYQPKPVLSGRKATDPIALPVTSWMHATSMVLRSSSPGRNRSGTALPSSS
jgi:hypothetical protein